MKRNSRQNASPESEPAATVAVGPYPDPMRPGCYRVPLGGRGANRCEAIIDAVDLPLVEGKRWHLAVPGPGKPGQVRRSRGGENVRLRQLIMGVEGVAWRVGHRNGNPLDCRRENLFVRTKQEQNHGARKFRSKNGQPCSSRFKGVCWDKWNEKWIASIRDHAKHRNLGRFENELAAAQAYDEAARGLFGEHARLNFPDGIDAWLERESREQSNRKAA